MRVVSRVQRAKGIAGLIAALAAVALAALWTLSTISSAPATADGPISPHLSAGPGTDGCAACHRSHTGQTNDTVKTTSENALCFSCHDGTGANANVAAEYNDVNVPADNPGTSTYYAHRLDTVPLHTSAKVDEFRGVLNRHSACTDCHNPHSVNANLTQQTANGWAASGALSNITGVNAGLTWQDPISYEYQLCLKCHSRYTTLLTSMTLTYNMTDKAAEFDPATNSYHPVEAAGKNATTAMQESLNGGTVWRLSTTSTIRCSMCHGNYRLVGNPPALGTPAPAARLTTHTSRYPGLLIANYRSRDLKPSTEAYNLADFSLCYICHSAAPFTDPSGNNRNDTNYRFHGYHTSNLNNIGSGGTDINILGAGQGNAICAECHFEVHGTKLAPWAGNQNYSRGVNFAPNVAPISGQSAPVWSSPDRTCALTCHGQTHNNESY